LPVATNLPQAASSPTDPIGVFDSGVGGLSVLHEIRRALPHEDLLYVADSRYAPYGERSREEIVARATLVTERLIAHGAKAIVVACNTATGAAVCELRARHTLPIIAMEPAVKPAAAHTRTGVVGVLATSQTLASHSFVQLLGRLGGEVEVLVQPCPGLVEQVEHGELRSDRTRTLLAAYLGPLLARRADTIVLGCTHYPHLRPLIQDLVGPAVTVLDSGAAVARQVHRRLAEQALLRPPAGRPGGERFWTSGDPARVAAVVAELWPTAVTIEPLPMAQTALSDTG
jgi:glutamate racemase